MSRMIFFVGLLTCLAGCQTLGSSRFPMGSIQTVAFPTAGCCTGNCQGPTTGCDGCIPNPTLAFGYNPFWDNIVTRHTAHRCAHRGLRSYRQQCGRPQSHHFQRGFIRAYDDLAMNRQPIPRVAPPPKYWNAYYRSCAGQPYVDDWFAGYDAGFEMGSDSGVSRFREVFLNRTGDPGPSHYGQAVQGNGSANVTGVIDQQGGNMPIPDPNSYGRRY